MPTKKTETVEKEVTAPEAVSEDTGDTRPMRPDRDGGRLWPVIRTYYNARTNSLVDVLEVTKTIPARLGQPAQQVKIEKHTHCRDAELQAKYTQKGGSFDITEDK
jgi:hypothetical protein